MKSGIYYYKFSSGRYYIGKATNISRRWQEHQDSFLKRTAAKKTQQEFDACGEPQFFVLAECHRDHCDILEALYINRYWNSNILNTVRPEVPSGDVALEDNLELLQFSTSEHLSSLQEHHSKIANLESEVARLEALVAKSGSEVPNTNATVQKLLVKNHSLTYELQMESNRHDQTRYKLATLEALNSAPWYKRIFN